MFEFEEELLELFKEQFGLEISEEGSKDKIRLHYKLNSIIEFYRQCQTLTPDGDEEQFQNDLNGKSGSWSWIGLIDYKGDPLEEIKRRKFGYKKGIEEIAREAQGMIQGYRKKVYKWNELDGDDLSMERLREHLPAMRKRVYDQGDIFGNFISLYFMGGITGGRSAESTVYKTKTAVKLVKFFESIGKRVEVILVFKSIRAGSFKGKSISPLLIEIPIKRFTDPLNISLVNTALSVWTFRYWKFLFMSAKFQSSYTKGTSVDIDMKTDFPNVKTNPIIINTYECLSQMASDEFIENILKPQK